MITRAVGLVTAIALACATPAGAFAQYTQPRWQPEGRLEVLTARSTAAHAVVGANAVFGMYVRLGLLAGAGARRDDDRWRASGSVSAIARFHLDPFREFPHGLYGGGGGVLLLDARRPSRVLAVVVVGYEGAPSARRWIGGVELGVGGGVRAAVTLRRARARGR